MEPTVEDLQEGLKKFEEQPPNEEPMGFAGIIMQAEQNLILAQIQDVLEELRHHLASR